MSGSNDPSEGVASVQAVVAGHICLDLIPQFPPEASPDLAPGTLTRVGPALRATGGPVSNVGLALHRLGVPTALMGKVGDDLFGHEVLRLLEQHDPALPRGMARAPGEATSYSIVISPPGVDRQFLHCPGANDSFGPEDVDLTRAPGARLLHFGYPPVMRRIYSDGGGALHTILAGAKAEGLATSLDTCSIDPASEAGRVDWHALLSRALPAADLFLPSFDELRFMLLGEAPAESGPPPVEEVRALAHECLRMGAAVVAIKLGEHGLYLRSTDDADRLDAVPAGVLGEPAAWRGRELLAPCFQAQLVSTTGSGDCTIAGLLAALLRGEGPEQAVRAATAVGACGVEAADAFSGVPGWPAVQRRVDEGWPRHPLRMNLGRGWGGTDGPHLGPADRTHQGATA